MQQTVTTEQTPTVAGDRTVRFVFTVDRFALNVARHWLLYASIVLGTLVLAPFAAPILMALGATEIGDVIYSIYGLLCHQLPQRSFFLFGPKVSYTLAEIGRAWPYDDFFTLRQFVGNSAMGWKVAWSDRMVAMYGALWLGGLVFAIVRMRQANPTGKTSLPVLAWLLCGVLPMAVDAGTHTINDALSGISGTGFRDTNAWLQTLTGNILPATFYAGDALGSFNNLARLVTGALFGFLTIGFIYPFVDWAMRDMERVARMRLSSPRAAALGFAPQVRNE
jgi:hypothetical protein